MGWRQPACLGSFEDPVGGWGGTILSPSGSAVSTGRNSSWTSSGGPQQAGGMKTKPGEAKMGPQRLPRPQAGGRQQPHGEWATETSTGCSCWLCQHPPAYRAWQSSCPPPAPASVPSLTLKIQSSAGDFLSLGTSCSSSIFALEAHVALGLVLSTGNSSWGKTLPSVLQEGKLSGLEEILSRVTLCLKFGE